VTYGSSQEADAAINGMNEKELDGRMIKVNVANARACKSGVVCVVCIRLIRAQREAEVVEDMEVEDTVEDTMVAVVVEGVVAISKVMAEDMVEEDMAEVVTKPLEVDMEVEGTKVY